MPARPEVVYYHRGTSGENWTDLDDIIRYQLMVRARKVDSIEGLRQTLQDSGFALGQCLCILALEDGAEFDELEPLQSILVEGRIVLLLPDDRPETIRRAHSFRPRFLAFSGDDPILATVLGNMVRFYCQDKESRMED